MIGALSIVRFRTPIRTPYELVHYFSLLTIGISAKVDLSITIVLIIILSILPYFIKRFSLLSKDTTGNNGKLSLNFQGLMNAKDFKKIISDKNIRNYSVKNEGDNINISGHAIFNETSDKDNFLHEWSSKINNYNVDLDETIKCLLILKFLLINFLISNNSFSENLAVPNSIQFKLSNSEYNKYLRRSMRAYTDGEIYGEKNIKKI